MDIYSYLKKDHKKVKELLEDILSAKSTKERKVLFDEMKYELLLHAKTEEDSFYKELENKKPAAERVEEAEEEHKEIEQYLKKLSELEFDSREWVEQFGEFKHNVTHHVKEEEEAVFDKAKKVLSDKKAKELAVEMDELKKLPKYQKKAEA
ncbi:MAG: Hemerythrin cation binding domain protein [Rickettsiaceae bacterium]|jgi:hemerythrin superfamily protein|nr:Hemerythrin cation binding domain protein [Rickettsiaceae bacterium]